MKFCIIFLCISIYWVQSKEINKNDNNVKKINKDNNIVKKFQDNIYKYAKTLSDDQKLHFDNLLQKHALELYLKDKKITEGKFCVKSVNVYIIC